jgi:putative Mn2+ efflux pump MntP
MNFIELVLIAIGLSMDAFAVSICIGLSMQKRSIGKALIVGLYFGFFQAFMPLIGYFLGSQFADKITAYDHWIAFILLGFIGGKMIKESLFDAETCPTSTNSPLSFKMMLPLSIATSIDALAVGVSFAFFDIHIVSAVLLIGLVTLIFSMVGVKIGNLFGLKIKKKAEFAGGVILILLGLKIVLEHTGIL